MIWGRENSKFKGPEVNELLVCLGREGEPAGQHTEREEEDSRRRGWRGLRGFKASSGESHFQSIF